MMLPALLSLVLVLVAPGILAAGFGPYPIDLLVMNSVNASPNQTYSTEVAYRGILIGAMKRLQDSSADFKFTYSENIDYGPFMESVNGQAGNADDQTYWELLVKTTEGEIIRPDVGIGCYIPNANEEIILKFTQVRSGGARGATAPPIVSFLLLHLILYFSSPINVMP